VQLGDQNANVDTNLAVYSCGLVGAPPRPSGNRSRNLVATAGGTSPSTFPPKAAISFTPLEEMKEYSGLAITYTVSISGARWRLSWCIWNPPAQSESPRRH